MPVIYNFPLIAQWHEDSGWSYEQGAVNAECSYTYLRLIMRGRATNPSIHVLGRIAAAYGHTLNELFGSEVPAGAA